jgi:hypothetical protein
MELFHANKQWSTRPADERFSSLSDLYNATKSYAATAEEKTAPVSDIRVENIDDDVQLVGKRGTPAKLTHWAFGQLSARVGAPASYLRELPATLAVQNLNHGLKHCEDQTTFKMLFHSNGGLLCRAFTSEEYARIWNWEVAARLMVLEQRGWTPAKPDIRKSAGDYPALYASDHDMFAFVRNNEARIKEPGNPEGLQRGVIVQNSEVGASSLWLLKFMYREMCGNHIIWGASNVMEIKVRHTGYARERWQRYDAEIRRYAESSAVDDEAKIARSRTVKLGNNKEEVLDKIFGMRALGLSRKTIDASYDAAIPDMDGAPNTQWGLVQGITRFSQTIKFADQRTTIDRAAGKLMEVDF